MTNANNAKIANYANNRYRIIYSLRVRAILQDLGFEPLTELDNVAKPRYKCWVYNNTEAFAKALDEIMGGNKNG